MNRAMIWEAINEERSRQQGLWDRDHSWGRGDCSADLSPTVKAAVLAEECGEVSRAVLEQDPSQVRTELIQVAAVAVAWLESL